MIWHSEPMDSIVKYWHTDLSRGLSEDIAAERADAAKKAESRRKTASVTFGHSLARRLKSPAVWGLLAVAAGLLGYAVYRMIKYYPADPYTPALLILLTVIRCLIGAFHDRRRGSYSLKAADADTSVAHVCREGIAFDIPAKDLVPGDVITLTQGDCVPADCRLINDLELRCDESALTGDSTPVQKDSSAPVSPIAPIHERSDMVYAGSLVLRGNATALVVETGNGTEVKKLASIQESETVTYPYEDVLKEWRRPLTVLTVIGALAIAAVAFLKGFPILSSLLLGLSFAVLASPDDAPGAAPAAWNTARRRLAAKGIRVLRPATVENWRRCDVLIADQAGCFTKNHARLLRTFANGRIVKMDKSRTPEDLRTLLQLSLLCQSGDSGDRAVRTYLKRHGVDTGDLISAFPCIERFAPEITRDRTISIHLIEGRYIVVVKGAADIVLPMAGGQTQEIKNAREFMEAESLRVIAVAYAQLAELPSPLTAESLEHDLDFLGLLGMQDPLVDGAEKALAQCRAAGIRTVMFSTGNAAATVACAKRIGLLQNDAGVITGEELAGLDDAALAARLPDISVCAHAAPEDKLRLVEAWQNAGHQVAVTGASDDIAALNAADVGLFTHPDHPTVIPVDVLLKDARLPAIVEGIAQCRAAADNLHKILSFRVASGIGTFVLMLLSLLVFATPLLPPASVLWLGVLTVALPALILAREPAESDAMRRPARRARNGISLARVTICALQGILLAGLAFVALCMENTVAAYAVWFAGQAILLASIRSSMPFGRSRLFRAPWAWIAFILLLILTLPVFFHPLLQKFAGIPDGADWYAVAGILAVIYFFVCEGVKWGSVIIKRR